MYDFANSGYTTVVLTAVFNAYFVSVIAGKAPWATFAWTATLAVSYALVMLAGPVIGTHADAKAAKKRWLFVMTVGCIASTAALYFAGPGMLVYAMIFVIISNFCYAIGENLTAAFLPELARPEAMGKVSGWGWSLGYVGGLVALGISLAWLMTAESRGSTTGAAVPGTLLITAVVYAVAASATFLWLKERAQPSKPPTSSSWSQLKAAIAEAWTMKDLTRVCFVAICYQAGVATVIALAAIYAQEVMGFTTQDTLVLVLLVNITACIGAFAFGYAQDKLGKVNALRVTLFGWVAMVGFAWFATDRSLFWIAANLAGLCMGSSQSAGRALIAYFAPPAKAAEMFGVFGLATRLAAILGPITYGIVSWVSGGDHRLAMLITGVFFIAAIVLLSAVDEARGRRHAESVAAG
ncbi:MAG: MFS transporter [Betaproteobacteria bacterium]|nr:MFS transporter [Betaproteobacteria bacterium]